jgi:hypothetical protein
LGRDKGRGKPTSNYRVRPSGGLFLVSCFLIVQIVIDVYIKALFGNGEGFIVYTLILVDYLSIATTAKRVRVL